MKTLSKLTLAQLLHELQETTIRMERNGSLDKVPAFQKAFTQNRDIRDEILRRFNSLEGRLNEELAHAKEY